MATNGTPLSLASVMDLIVPYCGSDDLARLSLASRNLFMRIVEAVGRAGKLSLEFKTDEQCNGERFEKILCAASNRVVHLGNDLTDASCARLDLLFSLIQDGNIELDASRCSGLSQDGLEALFNAFHSFSSINLSSLWRVSDAHLNQIVANDQLGKLESLNLARCYRLTDISVRNLRGLRTLNLERCVSIFQPHTLSVIFANNPDLEELNLAGVSSMLTNEAFAACRPLLKLKKINLEGANELTDSALVDLCRIAPRLQWLSLARCMGLLDMNTLFEKLGNNLVFLDLSGCRVFSSCQNITSLSGLRRLSELEARQTDLDARALRTIGRLPSICKLTLNDCAKITDDCIEVLVNPGLAGVALGGCENVSDTGMALLLNRHGSSLKYLQLPPNATDATLLLLGRYAAQIETLDMGRAHNITDEGALRVIASCGSTLKQLRLDETLISDAFLSLLPIHAPRMEKVTGYACPNTTAEGFDTLDNLANSTLRTLMDREGRMLRCHCCPGRRSMARCLAPIAKHYQPALEPAKESERFLNIEAPVIALSCAIILIDWFMS